MAKSVTQNFSGQINQKNPWSFIKVMNLGYYIYMVLYLGNPGRGNKKTLFPKVQTPYIFHRKFQGWITNTQKPINKNILIIQILTLK